MAFDQSSVPKDLRPLNIVRNATEDPRLAPLTSAGRPIEGFYTSPPADLGSSPGTMPNIYYPPMLPDAAFLQLGFSNSAVPGVGGGWVPHVVPLKQPPNTANHPAGGSGNNQICWPRVPTSALDNNSEDDLASSHKIKFLCSFGGKILPRLSDGALRYVGGQTRIISVRRNVSFSEFIGKMTDTYAQGVSVKYQLPDEDLDALVSVSCPDDLNNMMDEYEKLVERCPDGSAKLRIFLFTPSDVECGGFAGVGDVQDCGQMYVEAVNGVLDGLSGNSCNNSRYARKERIESVVPVQNSLDLSGAEGGDGLLANHLGDFIGVPSSCGGNYANNNSVSCTEPSSAQTGISVGTGPGMSEREVERSVPVTVVTQPVSPYIQAYMNPQQESMNHANFVQIGNVLGPMRPAFAQPQPLIPAGVFPQPVVHMKMNPSLMSMNPHVLDPQQVRMEHFPLQRPVEITADLGYSALPTQVLGQGVAYNWHQVPHLVPRFEDCYMCQKALPHAHSDTIAQEKNEVTTGIVSDMKSIYSSVQCDSQGQSVIRPVLPMMEDNVKQLASGSRSRIVGNTDNPKFGTNKEGITGVLPNIEVPSVSDKAIFQKAENPGALKATHQQDTMMTSGVQYTYGVLVANPPQSCQPNAVHNPIVPPKFQVNNDFSPIGVSLQTKDPVLHESPKSYAVKVSGGVPMDESSSLVTEPLRQIDEKLENLKLGPPVVLSNTEHNKLVVDPRKQDTHNITCAELYEMTDPSPVGNLNTYPYSNQGINHLRVGDPSGNTVYPGIDAPHTAERILPAGEWKDSNTAWSQSKVTGLGDATDSSISLFSNQDPWNIRLDKHFPPPKPTKIQIRKDIGPREETRLLNIGEAQRVLPLDGPLGDVGYQQSSYQDFDLDRSLSNKGSTEELIKQELQAVAEGVAASVFHSPVPSIPDLSLPVTQQNGDVQLNNVEMQQKDKLEEIKTNLTDKINFGFPASGMGRLQIIRNCDLEELQELGSGTFGTVYHGKWRGTDVAIKRINDRCFAGKPSEQERMRDDFWNEAIKLADLHHPNVVAFYGVVLDGPGGSIATVTEYMVNGSLRNAFQKSERNLDKRKRLLIGMDVAFGMEYLHGKNIVHFDLKSDNLLVNLRDSHRPICKVSDLGLSKVKCQTLISGGVRGTLPWMAPELLNGSSSLVSEKVDVFSFGIVMWELLTGEEPYADLHYGAIIGGIVSNTLRPVVPEGCDPDWRALMERCWSSEPSDRPNFTEIANELRAMATKLPSKQHQPPSNNPHIKG